MAIRNIVKYGDDILTKKCRTVEKIDERINVLIDDMLDTLYQADGVGLAAPQVGILKRIAVIDVGDGPIVLINPEIISEEGSQTAGEGCLSYPGKYGEVTRPMKVVVSAMDRDGSVREIVGEELLARALCHEIDHLDGHMFIEKVTEWYENEEDDTYED